MTEREELVGRLNFASRLPQYLDSSQWVRNTEISVADRLDDSDIDRRRGASPVDVLV